jgi:hypothetical protein
MEKITVILIFLSFVERICEYIARSKDWKRKRTPAFGGVLCRAYRFSGSSSDTLSDRSRL